jgi:signal transduction histidine kinase
VPTQRPAPTNIPRHRRPARAMAGLSAWTALNAAEPQSRELAHELHDELGSLLTAARLDVAWLRQQSGSASAPAQAIDRLERLEALLLEGHARLRQVVQGLYPRQLELFGLPAALHLLVREQAARFPGQLYSDIAEDAQVEGLAALALYRCAQECLTNLHRHANARQARLTLMRRGDRVQLQIRDDGRGFEPDGVGADHHGLAGMRARLQAATGELEIVSRPGGGTCITASVRAPTAH